MAILYRDQRSVDLKLDTDQKTGVLIPTIQFNSGVYSGRVFLFVGATAHLDIPGGGGGSLQILVEADGASTGATLQMYAPQSVDSAGILIRYSPPMVCGFFDTASFQDHTIKLRPIGNAAFDDKDIISVQFFV